MRSCLIAVLAAVAATGCGQEPARPQPKARPNVLLVTIDTLRADRVGCYGYAAGRTPTLDALAARGVRFEQAWTSVPLTLPAHATLLTGLEPPEHGVRVNGRTALAGQTPVLAERAREADYATGAFVSSAVLDEAFGLARGFQVYNDELGAIAAGAAPVIERNAADTLGAARQWIAAHADQPWLAWVHLYDPHMPWQAPEPWRSQIADPYDAEIAAVDAQLAQLLASIDLAQTLVVVTSDHGEGLGEHGEQTHGVLVHEATLRVPLIMAGAALPEGVVVSQPVGLVELAPTLTNALGWPTLGRGRDWAPAWRGEVLPTAPLYAESEYARLEFGWASMAALRVDALKLIEAPTKELYDLTQDARELQDLAAQRPTQVEELSQVLEAHRAAMRRAAMDRGASTAARVDPHLSQALNALGYAGGSGTTAYSGRDPRRSMAIIDAHAEGASMLQHGQAERAVAPLARAVEAAPEAPVFRLDYARALAATGAVDQARGQLLEALRLAPDLEQAHYHLAILQTQAGELDAALRSYELSLQLAPTAWPSRIGRAWVLVRLQREAEAAEELARVIAQRPQERGLRLDYARLLRGLGRNAEALTQLREAVALDPKDLGASAWLAWELAVQADDALRDGARALQLAEALVASSAQRNADHLEILAAALAEVGLAQEAAQAQRQALAVAPSDLDPRLREAWTARVELYARGGKHREP